MGRQKFTASETSILEPAESPLRTARALGADPALVARVRVAAIAAAVAVATEAGETANHTNRAQLARQVLMSPERWGVLMAEAVAVNPTITAAAAAGEAIPDDDIRQAVASLWDAYAGKGGGE